MSSRWKTTAVAALTAAGVSTGIGACQDHPEADGQPPEVEPAVAVVDPPEDEPPSDDEDVESVVVEFATWPGGDEKTFGVMWLGGDETLTLVEKPEPDSEIVAEASWLDGQELEWMDTIVVVDEPRPFVIDDEFVSAVMHYDIDYAELEAEETTIVFEEGQQVYLYRYDGEQTCYLGTDEGVVLSDCPAEKMAPADEVEAYDDPWTPRSEQWWVEVDGDGERGWFRVEEAPVEVHPRKPEGYDELEPEPMDKPNGGVTGGESAPVR